MKIGVIGIGKISGTVGRLWAKAGHDVRYGVRVPADHKPAEGQVIVSVKQAAAFGEVLFAATPYGAWPDLAAELGSSVSGKVLIDAANLYPERDGKFAQDAIDAGEGSGAPVQHLLPKARIVRAFNTVNWEVLGREAGRAGDRIGIPLASDDGAALAVAANLVRDAGFEPVELGPLSRAADFDAGTPVYNTGMSARELREAFGLAFHEEGASGANAPAATGEGQSGGA